MPKLNEENCMEFTPRQIACPGWPVRVANQQGLWRYIGPINPETVEVIGPYFPGSPHRNGGRSRLLNIEQIKYAGKTARPVDVISVEATALSQEAKRAKRR